MTRNDLKKIAEASVSLDGDTVHFSPEQDLILKRLMSDKAELETEVEKLVRALQKALPHLVGSPMMGAANTHAFGVKVLREHFINKGEIYDEDQ